MSDAKQTEVRFYRPSEGDPPNFVVVDGDVYRREEDQEDARAGMALDDLRAQLMGRYGPEIWDQLREYSDLHSRLADREQAHIEERLLTILPQHAEIVRWAFDQTPEPSVEVWNRHRNCKLPA